MSTAQYMTLDEKSQLYPERGAGSSFPVTTPLERTLIIIVAIVVAIGIALSITLATTKKADDENEQRLLQELKTERNTCYSTPCISAASHLLNSMDQNVDPCSDFYSFVCGNWLKNQHLKSSVESMFTKQTKTILLRVKGILDDLEKEKDLPEHKEKAKMFYKSCTDKAHRTHAGTKELDSDLKAFGGWPLIHEDWDESDFYWPKLMVQLFKSGYVHNMLFSVNVEKDAKNTSRSLISVSQPAFALKSRQHYSPENEMTDSYKNAIYALAKHLHPERELKEKETMEAINEAFKLESRIANITTDVNLFYPETYYHIKTLEELESFAPKIPWRYLLENFLPPNTELTNEERIMVTVPETIKQLNNILEEMEDKKGHRALANYMLNRVVFSAAHYLSKPFYGLVHYVFDSDTTGPMKLWEACAKLTMELLPLSVSALYVDKYMDNATKETLEVMVDDIKSVLKTSIEKAEWLDQETRNYALYKVDVMRSLIGYANEMMEAGNLDSFYKAVNITDDHFHNVKQLKKFKAKKNMEGLHEKRVEFRWTEKDNLLTANAYYDPTLNSITIPVGILHDPFFASGRPNYLNYGSLGMIIGHEMTHAFDSIGSLYDADGNYREWWSKTSWRQFEARKTCYTEQYSKYYVQDANAHVNGTLTLPENIADNGGLQTSYYAYNSLLKRKGSEKLLPSLHFSEKQMFWISYASEWCKKQTEESMQFTVKHFVHTPSRFRVIGSLSNMEEFSEDFHCKPNATMNPATRCSLWI